jgi:hypothetical protein
MVFILKKIGFNNLDSALVDGEVYSYCQRCVSYFNLSIYVMSISVSGSMKLYG